MSSPSEGPSRSNATRMEVMANDASSLAAHAASDIGPKFSLGKGNTVSGGTMIAGDYISTTNIQNIYPNAEPTDSPEARDALISDITSWFDLKSNSRAIHNDVKKKRDCLEGHFHRIYYVVDGVDEVNNNNRFDLIQVFKRLQGNIIFASRPLEHLQTELEGARYLTFLAQDEDLRLLIEDRLRRYPGLCRILKRDNYREEATRKIADKAAGMFLHAALQIEALRTCLSPAAIEAKLEEFPAGIEGMYANSISRIESQDPELVRIAKQMLFWLVFSRGPLSLRDLQAALAVNPETHSIEEAFMPDEQSIIDLCCGLVEFNAESNVVRLVHFTAKDALEPMLRKDNPQPHLFISKVLAQRMVDHNIPHFAIAEHEDFDALIEQKPLLGYAYRHWGTHILECGDSPEANHIPMGFLRRCTSFPCKLYGPGSALDLLQPLHVAAHYALPIYLEHTFVGDGDPDVHPMPNTASSQGASQPAGQHTESATINEGTMLFSTALIIASALGHLDFVKQLLQIQSVDVNANDKEGVSALHLASVLGHREIVQELLQVPDIDVNGTDNDGWTALILASQNGHDGVVSQLLRVPGIEVNAATAEGVTALIQASQNGHDGVVSLLLRVPSIQVNATTNIGVTALMLASQNGHDGVVSQLLQVPGIKVNAATTDGGTALMLASQNGHDGVVTQLLRVHGIEVNGADNNGWTALMLASHNGHDGVVTQLLQFLGIDVDVANSAGATALSAAQEQGHTSVVELLTNFTCNRSNPVGTTQREKRRLHSPPSDSETPPKRTRL
ncbi:ankyrin repeat domain-containing protein 29 [Coprinopsis cinerea okayama7|uniref:Ankyrin repeat domain-containing protein 29 n=1 Tax=Coprinopsis cinerea (strain Okayama-7 / 130 / ATCC MYA-4618 / FGSC 9003) TaxID=240176 RepID=A8P0X3_COPC7|nr:ankyrin repeat domain-containing protein 29 [Coprinopsis cinerea okayama7\|eukprot:XP_001837988.2 ankyrin repeat domain-containing protein 29 [Coprinopsis cinerea okayama7\